MSKQKQQKLNQLQHILGEGLLAPAGWLENMGYSRALLSRYVKSGWLESPARGVYRRPGPALKWQNVVASLQLVMKTNLHVGGATALVQRGMGHYVRMSGEETIVLYGPDRLPSWVNLLGLKQRFEARNDTMLSNTVAGLQDEIWGAWDWRLTYSTVERAMFELLEGVPQKESIYEAYVLMQGLVNLRPTRVMALLTSCTSVKVKRLFLAMADLHQHQWMRHLDLSNVDLGNGKRMLIPGGKLHPTYLITLPDDLDDHAR